MEKKKKKSSNDTLLSTVNLWEARSDKSLTNLARFTDDQASSKASSVFFGLNRCMLGTVSIQNWYPSALPALRREVAQKQPA